MRDLSRPPLRHSSSRLSSHDSIDRWTHPHQASCRPRPSPPRNDGRRRRTARVRDGSEDNFSTVVSVTRDKGTGRVVQEGWVHWFASVLASSLFSCNSIAIHRLNDAVHTIPYRTAPVPSIAAAALKPVQNREQAPPRRCRLSFEPLRRLSLPHSTSTPWESAPPLLPPLQS